MKTVQWALIVCRVLAVSVALGFLNSGCSHEDAPSSSGLTEKEAKWNIDSRKAMEENAAQAAKNKKR